MSKDDYTVGKRRPPKRSQYKKGQSGNPSGRRKLPDVAEAAARILEQKISVTQDGVMKKMPGLDALLGKAFAKALTGDMRAAEFLIKIVANDNARRPDDGQEDAEHDAADADIIERYYERYVRPLKAGGEDE
jgi:hypothetical protein